MIGIILSKRVYFENSLLLDVLFDTGAIHQVKLPGILKSKKRYSLHTIASIWDFKFDNLKLSILIPKESTLILLPTDLSPTYDTLIRIHDLMKPTQTLFKGILQISVYEVLFNILKDWKEFNNVQQEQIINYFYIFFLEISGCLDIHSFLNLLKDDNISIEEHIFHLGEGIIHHHSVINSKMKISCLWLLKYYNFNCIYNELTEDFNLSESRQCRENILDFLSHR